MLKNEIINKVIIAEGGLVNDKDDPGGLTNYGITKPFMAWMTGRSVESITDAEIINMAKDTAAMLYAKFWEICKVDSVPQNIQHIYIDMCINHGQVNAVKILQRAVNACGGSVYVDGRLGPMTITAVSSVSNSGLLQKTVQKRIDFYNDIVATKPKMGKFLNGWVKRANSFLV